MLATIPAFTASRASSPGVQCVTGTPSSFGSLHARTTICANCSAENFGGVPLRSSSASTSQIKASSSSSSAFFASSSASFTRPSYQRFRHRRERWASTPICRPWSTQVLPEADNKTNATLSASRFGSVREREKRSRIARWRYDSSTGGACRDMPLA